MPVVERAAAETLDEVPARVAAEAMRTVGQLAAGDAAAWRAVKQATSIAPPVLVAGIGIHYVLLVRVEDGALRAFDLVTREGLLVALKRHAR